VSKNITELYLIAFQCKRKLSMVIRSYNPSTQEAKARKSQVQGQPELYTMTLSQKKEDKCK
jgi:hypothetical protein